MFFETKRFLLPPFLPFTRCRLPVCNEVCETGKFHKLECAVFSAVVNYDSICDKKGTDVDGTSVLDDTIDTKDAEELVKTFQISKYDSPSPIYSCITPLRMLLKYQEDMTRETANLQGVEDTKDQMDVSKYSVAKKTKQILTCEMIQKFAFVAYFVVIF